MKGEYWFNSEPISKHIDIFFEYDKYQFVNNVVHLYSIEELKVIASNIKERLQNKRPYSFVKEYASISLNFGLCEICYELPGHSYTCYIEGEDFTEIIESYVYIYEHFEDRFKRL